MTEIITAVYSNGVLHPLHTLNLHEYQTVRIYLLPEETDNEAEETIQIFVDAGLMLPPTLKKYLPLVDPVSKEERKKLADTLGNAPGKSLSEIVIDERGKL